MSVNTIEEILDHKFQLNRNLIVYQLDIDGVDKNINNLIDAVKVLSHDVNGLKHENEVLHQKNRDLTRALTTIEEILKLISQSNETIKDQLDGVIELMTKK